MKPIIKWNADLFGVEIQTKEEHFVINASPSMVMNWNDAVRYFDGNEEWNLPTQKQLQIVVRHIDDVNALIKANEGCEIQGWHWTADKIDEFCAWSVRMYDGSTYNRSKVNDAYVRAVSVFQD